MKTFLVVLLVATILIVLGFLAYRFRSTLARTGKRISGASWHFVSRYWRGLLVAMAVISVVLLGWHLFQLWGTTTVNTAPTAAPAGPDDTSFAISFVLGLVVLFAPVVIITLAIVLRWWRSTRRTTATPVTPAAAPATTAPAASTVLPLRKRTNWFDWLVVITLVFLVWFYWNPIKNWVTGFIQNAHGGGSASEKKPNNIDLHLSGLQQLPLPVPSGRPVCADSKSVQVRAGNQIIIKSKPGCWSDQAEVVSADGTTFAFWGWDPPASCGKVWRMFGDGTWDVFLPGENRVRNPHLGNIRFISEFPCSITVNSYDREPPAIETLPAPPAAPEAAPAPTPTPAAPPASDATNDGANNSGVPKSKNPATPAVRNSIAI